METSSTAFAASTVPDLATITRSWSEAAAKAYGAYDLAALWNAELELLGAAAQMSAASARELWAACVEQQSQLARAALAQGNGQLQCWLEGLNGSGGGAQ